MPKILSRFGRWFRRWIYPTLFWEFLLLGALAGVVYVLIDSAYFIPPEIIIEDVVIPKPLQDGGYSGHLLAAQIADEIRNIQRVGRTTKRPINAALSEAKPDVEVRTTVFTLASIMSFVRPLVGNADHVVVTNLHCDHEKGAVLSLQGSYSQAGLPKDVAHIHVLNEQIVGNDIPIQSYCNNASAAPKPAPRSGPSSNNFDHVQAANKTSSVDNMDKCHDFSSRDIDKLQPDNLSKRAAQVIVKNFDPFVMADYHLYRARYYEGRRLLANDHLLGDVGDTDFSKLRDHERDCGREVMKYSLGLDISDSIDERADEPVPYDKSTLARSTNLWGFFYFVNTDDLHFEYAKEKFSEALQMVAGDANRTREFAFVHENLGDAIWISAVRKAELGAGVSDWTAAVGLATDQYRMAIREGEARGYASWGELLLGEAWISHSHPQWWKSIPQPDEAYRMARAKFRASAENSRPDPAIYKGWGDAIWRGQEIRSNTLTDRELDQAIDKYRKAIVFDSTWAPAYVKLSFGLLSKANRKSSSGSSTQEIENIRTEATTRYCRAKYLYQIFADQYRRLVFVPWEKEEFDELRRQYPPAVPCSE